MVVEEIQNKERFAEVLRSNPGKLVVADFFAEWCGPCRMMKPRVENMSEQFTDVIFIRVDVDSHAELSQENNIDAMPTFILFKEGQKVDEFIGASETRLKSLIEQHR